MAEQLSSVERSRRIASGAEAVRDVIRFAGESREHPDHDQITAYVDGTLDDVDREIVGTHLETCAICAEDVEDLRAVAESQVRVFVPRHPQLVWYLGAAVAAAATVAGIVVWTARTRPQPSTTAPAPSGTVLSLEGLSGADRDAVVGALRAGRVDVPAEIAALRGQQGTLLGGTTAPPQLVPLTPLGTTVESTQPSFEWSAVTGVTSYVVSVFTMNLEKVADSGPISATRWTPPQPLPRGTIYTWQIRARVESGEIVAPAPPAPEARFRVLTEAEARRVAALRRDYASSPLALGVLLGRMGLMEEARRELGAVVIANPSSEQARQLLASVR